MNSRHSAPSSSSSVNESSVAIDRRFHSTNSTADYRIGPRFDTGNDLQHPEQTRGHATRRNFNG